MGIGFSHQRVPSLSNTATRSSTGTASAPSQVRATKSTIACFAAPSSQVTSAVAFDEPTFSVLGTTATTLEWPARPRHHPRRMKNVDRDASANPLLEGLRPARLRITTLRDHYSANAQPATWVSNGLAVPALRGRTGRHRAPEGGVRF